MTVTFSPGVIPLAPLTVSPESSQLPPSHVKTELELRGSFFKLVTTHSYCFFVSFRKHVPAALVKHLNISRQGGCVWNSVRVKGVKNMVMEIILTLNGEQTMQYTLKPI